MTCQDLARDAIIVAGLIGGAVGFGLGALVSWMIRRRPWMIVRAVDYDAGTVTLAEPIDTCNFEPGMAVEVRK